MSWIRVLVIDESAHMREGINGLLRSLPGGTIVGEGAKGLEALGLALACHANLIVLDINMAVMGGLEALPALKSECQAPPLWRSQQCWSLRFGRRP